MARRSTRVKSTSNVASPTTPSRSSPRGTKRKVSYKEKDSDSSDEGIGNFGADALAISSNGLASNEPIAAKKKRSAMNDAKPYVTSMKQDYTSVQLDRPPGKTSSYQSNSAADVLPVELWTRVIFWAAQLLIATAHHTSISSTKWLLSMALVCKKLSGPALEILYCNIPLLLNRQWERLADTLDLDPKQTWTEYPVKVRNFGFYLHKAYFCPSFSRVLKQTTQLQGIGPPHCHFDVDKLGYSSNLTRIGHLPQLLRDLLDSKLSLKTWNWNFSSAQTHNAYPWYTFMNIHRQETFKKLTTLTLAQYNRIPAPRGLSSALCALTSLKHLAIIHPYRGALDAEFWPALPSTLESLSLAFTWIDTNQLISLFKAKGFGLRKLSLSHNHHLTLAFILDLASACPRLISLRMLGHVWTSASIWDEAIEHLSDKVPTWPTSLQNLELLNITNLNHEFAQTFFQTLLDASANLKDLRTLIIKVGVDIPLRERTRFRHSWVEKMETAYLRHCPDPNPEFYSIAAAEASLLKSAAKAAPDEPIQSGQAIKTRRNARSTDLNAGSTVSGRDIVVQGLCDTVEIRIDNLRPTSTGKQFTEEDFLDSEVSGDSEWDGDGSEDGDYAW